MWSSGGDDNINNKDLNRGVSKSSSTSSSSSSSTSFSPSSTLHRNPTVPKTMEEVWKDISLASLHDHPTRDDRPNFRAANLQDFLARPFASKDHPQQQQQQQQPPPAAAARYGSPPPLATALSLNSGPGQFHFLGNSDPLSRPSNPLSHAQPNISNVCASFNVTPFDGLGSPPSLPPANEKKRFPEPCNNTVDRRYKRMIKNRESAARSRARKQAYTNELELEVAHLMEENARLKKQQQQLSEAEGTELPKKRCLNRTSTAPF